MPRSRPRRDGPEGPQELGSILDQLAGEPRLAEGMSIGRLARQWQEVVGERLALECSPIRLEGRVLLVRATSAAWATQIRFLADQVAGRANSALGRQAVEGVRVVVGEAPTRP